MSPNATEYCPLQVTVSATSDALLEAALAFTKGLAGPDAGISIVPPDEVPKAISNAGKTPAELIVMAREYGGDGTGQGDLDAATVAMESPVPVMVLQSPAGERTAFPMVERILVPLDGSARSADALPLAAHIARGAGLPVLFVMVIDPSRVIPPAFAYDPDAWTIVTELQETAHWALKQAEAQMTREGVQVESSLVYGPVNACLQAAIQVTDLVVMTTQGSGKKTGKIGSVAARVLATAAGPVIVHRGHGQNVVVVDGYEACSWVEPLSRRSVMVRRA